ncbi:hypothetical protein LGT39_10825 [Demequina sp. TTPB684]|uniref:hypothetical protein n=1 Tax=unclassified Demequina TaxID=2620311 RepID=UPI001CF356B7|nr:MULTISPECIES: hypothetical protein [unclassified Demequina]MCB2413337.1 hypothetical protein [Demequina sp. TTPB684]UPU87475.1 hypothetical protein LGT36_009395 [Demequina sp. TMPB413]
MSADTDAVRDAGLAIGGWASTLAAAPHTAHCSLSQCGSSLVAGAGATSEDNFRVQALVIETEMRDLAQAAGLAASALEVWDRHGINLEL